MKKKRNITVAIICVLTLVASSFGAYTENAKAAGLPVTSDNAQLSQGTMEKGTAKANVQELEFGKKTQGRLVTGDDGQQYQITLDSSGQLDIHLEGAAGKLATRLTDKDGKGWSPRRKTADGKQTYQLKKGTYYYQVQIAKGAQIPETGINYAVTATFKSAKAKFEDNTTRGKAAKLPLYKEFYGHLAQNSPTEYYKVVLKNMSMLSFTINTQMSEKTPETFSVSLYDKHGRLWSHWENPDWTKGYEDGGCGGDWKWCDDGSHHGMVEILPAGTYYVGVSIKRDESGKVPLSSRYGRYAAFAWVTRQGISVKLSHKQAEYTGKEIKHPKVTFKKNFKKSYYEDWDDSFQNSYAIDRMSGNPFFYPSDTIKEIGRYRVRQERWYLEFGRDADAYAIFTVTPVRGKINRVSSKKKGQVQVSVKKNAESTGYEIQIARDKKFKKSIRTLKTTNLKETLKGLSHGKKYYVRVRNYKDVKTEYCLGTEVPESIYGKWSKTRTVVCK